MNALIRNHIQIYTTPTNTVACKHLIITGLIQAVALFLINSPWSIIGWILNTLNYVRTFIIFHDLGHYSYFPNIKINSIIGHFIGIYIGFPFHAWRDGHNVHHSVFGNLDHVDTSQTILFTKKQYESFARYIKVAARIIRDPLIFHCVTIPVYWIILMPIFNLYNYGLFSLTILCRILTIILYLYFIPNAIISGYIAIIIGGILFHLQHSVNIPYRRHSNDWNKDASALNGSTYLIIPNLLKVFTHGIEYHHIHHFNTKVPGYMMSKCHNHMSEQFWQFAGVNYVGYIKALSSLSNVMYDEDTDTLVHF